MTYEAVPDIGANTEQPAPEAPAKQTGEPENPPEQPSETIPEWAHRILEEFRRFWESHLEHHNRIETLISDVRRAGIPLEGLAAHYKAYNAPLPTATPWKTEPAEDQPAPGAEAL